MLPSCAGALFLHMMSVLRGAIIERRLVIRYHRDQRLDDRCWLDDYLVWAMRADSPADLLLIPSFEGAMQKCRQFYLCRRAEKKDPAPAGAVFDKNRWDKDLMTMTREQLIDELARIQEVIRRHRDIGNRPRSANDDRLLYNVLPEMIPADFRLPPEDEFLGEIKSPRAGCPAFWRSHAHCLTARHNFHQWGPCSHSQIQY